MRLKLLAFSNMADLRDLSQIIENIGDKPPIRSSVNLESQEDAELERKLREIKYKQELRKDWILFILRDVVVFSAALVFIFVIAGYSLFTLSRGSSSREEKKFATSVLTIIVTVLVIFVIGNTANSK